MYLVSIQETVQFDGIEDSIWITWYLMN